jgi:hypothetical protein
MAKSKGIGVWIVTGLFIFLLGTSFYIWRSVKTNADLPLDSILKGLQIYRKAYKTYPPTLSALGGSPTTCAKGGSSTEACLVDNVLANGEKSGYRFHYSVFGSTESGRIDAFSLTADPVNATNLNLRHYFADQTGMIRVELGHPATEASPYADRERRQ